MFPTAILNNPFVDKYNEMKDQIVEQYNELKQTVLDNETVQRVLYALATILGIVVGVTVWVTNRVRQWYNNGGKLQMLKIARRVLSFVITTTEKLYDWVCDVTLVEVAQ